MKVELKDVANSELAKFLRDVAETLELKNKQIETLAEICKYDYDVPVRIWKEKHGVYVVFDN